MFDFEKLHRNHKFAYLDGLLCGIVITVMAKQFYDDYKDMKKWDRIAEESNEIPVVHFPK